MPHVLRVVLPLVLLGAAALSGCSEQEAIRQYRVKAEMPPDLAEFAEHEPAGPKGRTLGAMVPQGGRTWYFKMQGPIDAVGEQIEPFAELINSVKLANDTDAEPEWTLPAGWTQEPGSTGESGIRRFATLKTGGEKPLETTVIVLDGSLEDEDYLLANLNRWRRELSLRPVEAATAFRESRRDETRRIEINGREVVLVNLTGTLKPAGGAPFAPFAGGNADPHGEAAASGDGAGSDSAADSPLTFTTPEGWKPGRKSPARKAAFVVTDGDKSLEITAIPLTAQGFAGDLLQNVNRWREQLGLDPIEKDALDKAVRPVTVDRIEGNFIELTGARKDDGRQESILVAMVIRDGQAWFFKLQGDAELAAREKQKFEEFVKSVKFR